MVSPHNLKSLIPQRKMLSQNREANSNIYVRLIIIYPNNCPEVTVCYCIICDISINNLSSAPFFLKKSIRNFFMKQKEGRYIRMQPLNLKAHSQSQWGSTVHMYHSSYLCMQVCKCMCVETKANLQKCSLGTGFCFVFLETRSLSGLDTRYSKLVCKPRDPLVPTSPVLRLQVLPRLAF